MGTTDLRFDFVIRLLQQLATANWISRKSKKRGKWKKPYTHSGRNITIKELKTIVKDKKAIYEIKEKRERIKD